MWVVGLAYCNRNLTDGFIPLAKVDGLISWRFWDPDGKEWTVDRSSGMGGDRVTGEFVAGRLVSAGLWDEVDRGSTLFGPHRDDMSIVLNDLPARTHSSQGEAWSCALSLRLAQVDFVRRDSIAGDPVVVLDDVFSELDSGRRVRLGEHLAGIEHLIITAADVATIPPSLVGRQHTVLGGRIDV
jgi:hypothetical protein